jgi:hypothetical protein
MDAAGVNCEELFASSEARYITGINLNINAGNVM